MRMKKEDTSFSIIWREGYKEGYDSAFKWAAIIAFILSTTFYALYILLVLKLT